MSDSDHQNPVISPQEKGLNRLEPIALLPIFYKLEGRAVLLAGGGEGAAWKAELLAAAGAHVQLYAKEICEEMSQLLARKVEGFGTITHHQRHWEADAFNNVALALGDFESDDEAQQFFDQARASSVPVNVIDNPKFCEFQFGSIVNRSPAIVSISTDGAAPILGQAIRRRIETLIPPQIAQWAQIAQNMRDQISDLLPMGAKRRSFWEQFSNFAFQQSPEDGENAAQELLDQVARSKISQGRVTLVGAGPGDAELLTLGAVRALQSADVILFDDLASEEVLELARREAKRTLVGKRGGRQSCSQHDINEMMVELAKSGKHVVRLKSGDPTIFGRAGEEMARLEQAGIPVHIVPGVTSASAMAARLGVSLTHRDHAQSVRFVTGHSRQGKLPEDVDWRGIADQHTTTIFYMGGRTAPLITERLLAEGLSADTPTIVMSSITRAQEERWCGKLRDLPRGIEIIGFDNPVLIAVGDALGESEFAKASLKF